jgi:enamine deaminase RidA (YjgF/YER057c/UK114 family)
VNREINPSSIAPPAANYAHAVLSEGAQRILHVSGVVGTRPDGSIPEDIEDQAAAIWANIAAILTEAGMAMTDVVSITTYVVADFMACLPEVMSARDQAMGGHRAASTLVTVPALARAAWKMEIAVVACH